MGAFEMEANQVWRGKGNGAAQKIRILRTSLDRQRVEFERIEGPGILNKAVTTQRANVEAAFEYAGETLDTFV